MPSPVSKFEAGRCLVIDIKNRNNIKVYNHCVNRLCMRGAIREYEFSPAQNGVPSMIPMSFTDIEFANSKNPELFVTGLLTFGESERDEIYNALSYPDWQERFWTEEGIEDAILHPTIAKMQKILAVRDILTIERIRGTMTRLINTSIRKPIDKVIDLINGRWQEILRGQRTTRIEVSLPTMLVKEDAEKVALAAQNAELSEKMRALEEQIALLMKAQGASSAAAAPAKGEVKKPVARKTTKKQTE